MSIEGVLILVFIIIGSVLSLMLNFQFQFVYNSNKNLWVKTGLFLICLPIILVASWIGLLVQVILFDDIFGPEDLIFVDYED